MLKKGTIVNVYEDPFTRIRLEGQARIVRHEADLAEGAVLYTVVFLKDQDRTPRVRKLVESVSTEQCGCYDQQGDNPDCLVHVLQVGAQEPPEPEPVVVRCTNCGREMTPDDSYCWCQENILTDHGSQVVHVRQVAT